jgi:hypothetical protein
MAQPAPSPTLATLEPETAPVIVGLSTDYLNHYGEALMLMEMAGEDPSLVGELRHWRPITYREHFMGSQLRIAASALDAYEALDETARRAFESLCSAMNRLVETVLIMLDDADRADVALPVIAVATTAFHNLMSRARAFITSGGDMATVSYDQAELQRVIDQLLDA